MTLEDKVRLAIRRHGMVESGGKVIVALSGGADSVVLFHLLWGLREELGIEVMAAHFEHGLRGEESQQDAVFVQELCKKHGVKLFIRYGRMSDEPKPPGESVEAWARRLRYAFFERIAEEDGAKVATAHTLSDNAETVLFHAIRGAGPRGLAGIPPVRGPFIRPLLEASRAEVEAYCLLQGLTFRNDATNEDTGFTRNRLRLDVMPRLEQAHSGAAQSLGRLAGDMRELNDWLSQMATKLLRKASAGGRSPGRRARNEAISLDCAALLAAPAPVLRQLLALLAGRGADRAALERAEAVLRGEARAAQLPGGVSVQVENGRFLVVPENLAPRLPEGLDYELPVEAGEYTLPGGYRMRVSVVEAGGGDAARLLSGNDDEKKSEKGLTFCADYGKIYHCGVFRTRRPGDAFAFSTRGVSKPLKKWMNEEKLDEVTRASLPVLADARTGEVYWIWNEGFSAGVQPGKATRQFLLIRQEGRF